MLVISDHRPLNLGHAATLSVNGCAVYTAVTCTDVPRVFEKFDVGEVDVIVFASLVHGWHHAEGETRPGSMPRTTDPDWQIRNMKAVIDIVRARQERKPTVVIASELLAYGWYSISPEALENAAVEYHTYSVSRPRSILGFLP